MDKLSSLLRNFEITTKVFGYGTLCGESEFDIQPGLGHIHIIKRAPLEIIFKNRKSMFIDDPSVIFFPKPTAHAFKSLKDHGADMVCATVSIGNGIQNPLTMGLPEVLVIPISQLTDFEKIFDLLYQEAFDDRCGKQQAIDHLMDYLIVRIYRFAIQENLITSSAIAGLSDPKITKAVEAIHRNPGHSWCLDTLAYEAGMSRARFAEYFKERVGIAPINYLTELRINVAMRRLQQGKSIKSLYGELGYSSASSFTRVFLQKIGMSPKEWLANNSISN